MTQPNHYVTLGVNAAASMVEIRLAYRNLSWIHHPDRIASSHTGEPPRDFAEIVTAYTTLRDKRLGYDAVQELKYEPCKHCTKGAVYVQKGFNGRVSRICLRCNGSGFNTENSK